ncbi:hypothetical protein APW67_10735, partial [Staphylococcus aureus]
LLDVNYEAMDKVLKPNRKKIASKGIKSVRARVGHLREALDEKYRDITIEAIKNLRDEIAGWDINQCSMLYKVILAVVD